MRQETADEPVRVAEVVGALCLATDLAMGFPFEYVGRDASASPATGSHHVHEVEQHELVEAAFGASVPHAVAVGRNGTMTNKVTA